MKNFLKLQIKTYKKILVPLISFELLRGIFIIFIAWLFQCVIINGQWILILFIALACRIIIENFRMKKFNLLSLNFQEELRRKLHRSFFSSSTPIDSGEILTLIFNVVESFDEFFIKVLPNFLTIIILLPLILIVTSIIDPPSAMIFFVTLPIAPFLLYLIGQAVSTKNQVAMIALSKLNSDFRELISAITTLKIFKQIDSAITKLKSTSEQSAATTLEVLKIAFISAFALELITTLSIAIIAVTIGLRLVDDKIYFDVALFLLILAPEFYSPIRQLGAAFHSFIKAKDALIGLRAKGEVLRKNHSALSSQPSLVTPNNCLAQIVTSGPTTPYPEIMQGYVRAITAARRYIYIETPYFLPNEAILFALKTAIMAGVDVRLLCPRHSDARFTEWASRSYLREMQEAGASVWLYRPGFIHSKLMIVDDVLTTCGSTNVDFRSFENNFEANIFIFDEGTALRLKKIFLDDQSLSVRLEDVPSWLHPHFFQRLWESLTRLLSPLL